MPVGIRIEGLERAQKMLRADFRPAIRAATKAIAVEVHGTIAPYPPATEANSPGNPTGRWYERGYGPRWLRKDGSQGGRKTSQMLNRSWSIGPTGAVGHKVGSRASYAPYVHSAEEQAKFHGARGWITDVMAIQRVVRSGVIQSIVRDAIMGAFRRR